MFFGGTASRNPSTYDISAPSSGLLRQFVDQALDIQAFRPCAERKLHAVHQRRACECGDVVERWRQTPAQQRACAYGEHQSLSRAGAWAPRDVFGDILV